MTSGGKLVLFWSPRVLCLAFAGFISLFALDVFGERRGFWGTAIALSMHLIPTVLILLFLALAWRREWIGAVAFTALAASYFFRVALRRNHPEWALVISVPLLLVAGLFLANWVKRHDLRTQEGGRL